VIYLPYYRDKPSATFQLQDAQKRWRYFQALVDSGADFSIFPLRIAIVLGFDVEKSKKVKLEAADGHIFEAYKTEVSAKLDTRVFRLTIGFVDNQDITPAIGRAGFFETFRVEFDERNKCVKLRSYD